MPFYGRPAGQAIIFCSCSGTGHYILQLWFLSFFFLSFFPRLFSVVTDWMSTKLCMMFVSLLCWYTIYTFWGLLPPLRNFVRCKIHFASKSSILLYWQCYCTALEQWASAKLCGVQQRASPIFSRAAITWMSTKLCTSSWNLPFKQL